MPAGVWRKLHFTVFGSYKKLIKRLSVDVTGSVISTELLLLATTLFLGLLVGIVAIRDATVSELSDFAGAFQDLNQSYSTNGVAGNSSATAGSQFQDQLDVSDSAGDVIGAADNCIVFNAPPTDSEPATFILSDSGVLNFDGVITGVGGSAQGTIGDGTIDTGFTVTTDTGNIAGTTGGTELRFRENPNAAGSFTIAFDEPITEFEFWIRSLANIIGEAENLLGNFVLALSDGSIINNAAFNIIPDLIAPNSNFGLFRTRGTDTSPLSQVTRGGANFVTDPGFDGTPNQAAGRIVFPDIPGVGASPFQDAVGLQSLTFERSGGPTNSGFQTNISASGRVLREEP